MKRFVTFFGAAFLLLVLVVPPVRANDTETLRSLLKEIREALDAEKAKARPNAEAVEWFEGLLRKYKVEGDREWGGGDSGGGGREITGGMRRVIEGALADLELDDEETTKVTDIILDWYQSRRIVFQAKDRGANDDIDEDRDNRLKRLLGQKRAQTIIERTNRSASWMFRDWGGRGGRGGR